MLNGPVLAEDKDIGPNAVVKYHLLGARVDLFTVDANTGNTMSCSASKYREQLPIAVSSFLIINVSPRRSDICETGGNVGS